MALNYPRLDNASGVWNMKEVTEAVLGGYWPNATARGLWYGGHTPSKLTAIDYVTISTTGDAADFGDLSGTARSYMTGSMSNFTRGIFAGGGPGSAGPGAYGVDIIDYVTFVTTGNASDFGNLTRHQYGVANLSNSTRGIQGGGTDPTSNIIDYVVTASLGDATDFGDLSQARFYTATVASPTRGVWGGGVTPTVVNTSDYITIASTGDATDFGDLISVREGPSGASSSTRGVIVGGDTNPSSPNLLTTTEYLEIASTGNTVAYGDLLAVADYTGSLSNGVRCLVGGGDPGPSLLDTIQSFNIPVGGQTVDFGDLTAAKSSMGSASGGHGGLADGYQGVAR